MNQGDLPAILPFFIAEYGFNYTTAASLVFALNLISKVIRGGFFFLLPLLCFFIFADTVVWATLLLIPIGIALYVPFSPMVVMGQKYLPNRIGLASGVTLGLAVSVGGIAVLYWERSRMSMACTRLCILWRRLPCFRRYSLLPYQN
jgi:hypothetical protein